MRALIACLLVTACVTSPPAPPPERVAGCWIARGDEATTTFRWLGDAADPGRIRGDVLIYAGGASASGGQYVVERHPHGWQFCALGDGASAPSCWRVAERGGGSLEGGRAFIDQHNDRLRISVISAEGERLIFDGRRDGCD